MEADASPDTINQGRRRILRVDEEESSLRF
jgi:hypothetical protein